MKRRTHLDGEGTGDEATEASALTLNNGQHHHGGDCCSNRSRSANWFMKIYSYIWRWVMRNTKYAFYFLIVWLYPSSFYLYYFKFGEFPWNNFGVFLKMATTAFLCVLGYWSHAKAAPPNDPGFISWETFRTDSEQDQEVDKKRKWADPNYVRQRRMMREDPENERSEDDMDCDRCGSKKVEGVHHCGKCDRCVYKMDHHCPWTDNCVGYLTLKPFLLFLFYVTVMTYVTVGWMYMSAWTHDMGHISIMTLVPNSHLHQAMALQYASEEKRKQIIKDNEAEFQKQVQLEKEAGDDIFSIKQAKAMINSLQLFGKDSILYSFENFHDAVIIVATLFFGCYTLFLLVSTVYYVKGQTTLVDQIKIEKYSRPKERAKLSQRERNQLFKKKKELTTKELMMAIFHEEKLSWRCFIPVYPADRTIDYAHQDYLSKAN